jgi:hypothetical protein
MDERGARESNAGCGEIHVRREVRIGSEQVGRIGHRNRDHVLAPREEVERRIRGAARHDHDDARTDRLVDRGPRRGIVHALEQWL